LRRLAGTLPKGGLLVLVGGHADGEGGRGRRVDVDEVVAFVARARHDENDALELSVADAATWTRGRGKGLVDHDLVVAAVARNG
jgi:hypothetical protein